MKNKSVTIVKDKENPIGVEVLEQAIVNLSDGMKAIQNSRLTTKALVVLLHHATKVPQYQVESVLDALESIEKIYLK